MAARRLLAHFPPMNRHRDVFERHANDPRFARLLGEKTFNGWREEGPDFTGAKHSPVGLFD